MKITIFFLCIILILLLINHNNLIKNKETFFNILDIGDTKFITKNNVFLGYSKEEAQSLKELLKKETNIDISKGNLIINNKKDIYNFKKIFLNGISLNNNSLNEIFNKNGSNLEPRIKYQNYSKINSNTTSNEIITEFDENNNILYNHEDQHNEIIPPNRLCLKDSQDKDICIKKDDLSILNGNKTIKLKKSDTDEYLLPIYTYSGGDNLARYPSIPQETDPLRRPFEFIFYQTNNLVKANNRGLSENATNKLPHALDEQSTIYYNWENIRYFVLYNAYSKSYLSTNGNGLNYRSSSIKDDCIYEFDGLWNGIHGRLLFKRFCESNDLLTAPIGLKNIFHQKWLCNERTGWTHKHDCSIFATQNRPWFLVGWEGMYLQKIIHPTSAGGNFPLLVYIRSWGCDGALSAWTGLPNIHFSWNFNLNDPSIYGHNMWSIIPIATSCSEPCKADFNSETSCGPNNYCTAPLENKVSKKYQGPEDRPICRYYNGKHEGGVYLGHCSKSGYNEKTKSPLKNNVYNEKTKSEFRYAKPPKEVYDTTTINPSEDNPEPSKQKKDFYSEFTIKMAKSKSGKLYEPDIFSHYHDHT